MAGFFSPSIGGAFIGGAAKAGSDILEQDRKFDQQNDVIWQAKFAQGEQAYQKEKKDSEQNKFYYNQIHQIVKDPAIADVYMMQVLKAKTPEDVATILNNAKQSVGTQGDASQSSYLQSVESGLKDRYGYLQGIRAGARPEAQKYMTLPAAPNNSSGASNYGSPSRANSSIPTSGSSDQVIPSGSVPAIPVASTSSSSASTSATVGSMVMSGSNRALTNKELLKPEQFNDSAGYRSYIDTVNKNPTDPTKWDFSGVKSGGATNKLDPVIQAQVNDAMKNFSYMSPEDRQTYMNSVAQARASGDGTLIRSDLLPSQDTINSKAAEKATGIENGKKYSDALQKRKDNMFTVNKSEFASDDMIRMATSGQPIKAGMFQPFIDNINRAADGAGIDLQKMFGLKANRVNDVNEFKKVLADLTFDQIPNYHLGRWTNTEFNLLKTSLPSLDTDRNTVVKVALLFKNAAQREKNSLNEETKLAWGPNGERFLNPRAEDLGRAAAYGVSATTDTGNVPWTRIDARNQQQAMSTINSLQPGSWFEDSSSGMMGQKQADGTWKMIGK